MNKKLLFATGIITAAAWTVTDAATPAVPGGCHASLTVADARTLAVATPNARAFVDDFGATLTTAVRSQNAASVTIAVTAHDTRHGSTVIDIYTINLRTGHILDDAMESAEDAGTAKVRNTLIARHCAK